MKNYLEMVKNDILEVIDNYEVDWNKDADEIMDWLNDRLWVDDEVTGNGTDSGYAGLYTHLDVREMVANDMDIVIEALREFGVSTEEVGRRFINQDYEYLDITARCYVLGTAIFEVVSERKER